MITSSAFMELSEKVVEPSTDLSLFESSSEASSSQGEGVIHYKTTRSTSSWTKLTILLMPCKNSGQTLQIGYRVCACTSVQLWTLNDHITIRKDMNPGVPWTDTLFEKYEGRWSRHCIVRWCLWKVLIAQMQAVYWKSREKFGVVYCKSWTLVQDLQ